MSEKSLRIMRTLLLLPPPPPGSFFFFGIFYPTIYSSSSHIWYTFHVDLHTFAIEFISFQPHSHCDCIAHESGGNEETKTRNENTYLNTIEFSKETETQVFAQNVRLMLCYMVLTLSTFDCTTHTHTLTHSQISALENGTLKTVYLIISVVRFRFEYVALFFLSLFTKSM